MENANANYMTTFSNMLLCTDNEFRHDIFLIVCGLLLGVLCMKAVRVVAIAAGIGLIMLEMLRQSGCAAYEWNDMMAVGGDVLARLAQFGRTSSIPRLVQRGFVGGFVVGACLT